MDNRPEDAAQNLTCPGCGNALAEARVNARYGRVVVVDQCGTCGGVWFDKWELYSLDSAGLRSLHEVDTDALRAPNPGRTGNAQCPRCERPLVVYIDPALPKDAEIKRCGACSGLWLNRGGIDRYRNHKETVIDPRTAELRLSGHEAVRRLERELRDTGGSIPVDLSGLSSNGPEIPDLSTALESGGINAREVAKDVGYLILASLVRLIIPF
ncbi:MAG: zf-TFIIB domain-containing protein [Deltaproteobacteria bacterium]|nr:zf-TFIIB domain-containing protein [Deltaproteobacteria bacterium]